MTLNRGALLVQEASMFAFNEVLCLFLMSNVVIGFSDENARSDLKQLPILPTRVLKEHPSLNYWSVQALILNQRMPEVEAQGLGDQPFPHFILK